MAVRWIKNDASTHSRIRHAPMVNLFPGHYAVMGGMNVNSDSGERFTIPSGSPAGPQRKVQSNQVA